MDLRPIQIYVHGWVLAKHFYFVTVLRYFSEYFLLVTSYNLCCITFTFIFVTFSSDFLGHVALVRGVAGYSHQTLPWTICRSVRRCVGLSGALWKNGGSDPDAVWHHKSDGSRDDPRSGIWSSVIRSS